MANSLPIYTLDIETDPFKKNRYPKPFAIGFYDGQTFVKFWGRTCIQKMRDYIELREPGIIYAHNGGRFDVFYLMDWIMGNPMRIIKSRIIKAHVSCTNGWHEVRDSYAIMPFALGKFKGEVQKKEIDITKLERNNRVRHKVEILEYLERDCISLWILCSAFVAKFGIQLTIGTTAMRELKKLHTFDILDKEQDYDFRSKFYYGGRVECFQKGVLSGEWKVYDVNSMYPYAMKAYLHPIGTPSSEGNKVKENTCFISVTGQNRGAFPMRVKGGGINFDTEYGLFHVTRHEWDVAMEHDLFTPEKIHRCVNFDERASFTEFVDKFYEARNLSRAEGDEINALFYKFVLNSAYGKFGQNPDNYEDSIITAATEDLRWDGWVPDNIKQMSDNPAESYIVWKRASNDDSRYNVAAGASITGAARAMLLQGIASADSPVYCDTDSIVCRNLPLESDPSKLGAWKVEAIANRACIAGKKLYALFSDDICVKQANKGVKVTPAEIEKICNGETVFSERDAPSFKLDGSYTFISRRVRMT